MSKFWERIKVTDSGCWEWLASKTKAGYGQISFDGCRWYTHRLAYTVFVGEIPAGLHIDHLCRNRACCNPEHLEPVTCLENVRRGQGNGAKTHCPAGHPYSGENLRIKSNGFRICRTCHRLAEYRRNHGEDK